MTQTEGAYPTLSLDDETKAGRRITQVYHLTAEQRRRLSDAPMVGEILRHVHKGELLEAGGLLVDMGVIGMGQFALHAEKM